MYLGMALVIKGCLTIITFGIKLPGWSLPDETASMTDKT